MVVEYGFGEFIKNTSLIEVQDYALISGKEVLEDIQKIIDTAKEETEEIISNNKDVVEALADKLVGDILINSDGLTRFLNEHFTAS